MENHLKPTLGKVFLGDLSDIQIQRLYNVKFSYGLSAKTIKNIHKVLSEALTKAVNKNLIFKNVCQIVEIPKHIKKDIRFFSKSEQEIFLQSLKDEKFKLLFELDLASGLRLGEILALRWKDVDIHNRVIHVNQSVIRTRLINNSGSKKTSLIFSSTKNSYSKRKIPIPSNVFEKILSYKIQQAIKITEEKKLVFVSRNGTPVDPRTIIRAFHRVIEKAGLEHANFHSLRHNYATRLLEENIHPKIVQELLGHSNIQTTLDIYSHVIPDMKAEAVDKLNILFNKD